MKLHLIEETDTATVAGETLAGPLLVDCDKATVGAETFSRGVVVVRDGEAVRVAEMTPAGQWGLLVSLIGGVVLGLVASKQWVFRLLALSFLFSSSLLADYTVSGAVGVEKKASNASRAQRFYASVYDGGWVNLAMHEFAAGDSAGATATLSYPSYEKSGSFTVDLRYSYNNAGLWTTPNVQLTLQSSQPGSPPSHKKYDLYLPVQNNRETQSSYQVRWYGVNGEPEKTMEFDLPAYGKRVVHLSELYPFRAVVIRRWYDTTMVDGQPLGAGMEIDVEPEDSIETDVENPPTAEELEPSVTEVEIDYDKPPSPSDEPRPPTVETLADLNEATEARHGEAQGQLENVNEQLATGIRVAADAAGQAKKDAKGIEGAVEKAGEDIAEKIDELKDVTSETGVATAEYVQGKEQTMVAAAGGFWASADGLVDEIGMWGSAWALPVSGAQFPVLEIPLPSQFGGEVELDLGDYASVWGVMRAVLLVVVAWHFLTLTLETIRGGVA